MSNIKEITAQELYKLAKKEKVIIIDVREKIEHKACSIKKSINIPLAKINANDKLFNKRNSKIVIHCEAGNRSEIACAKLKNNCNAEIYNLIGGISEWQNNNYALNKTRNIFSITRQVQLTISLLSLTGLILYYITAAKIFLLIPSIMALGLLNAAITGWCGLAKLLMKMPWNK
jgi:rhodanese-related sulfurtransferase